jgi:hypothetical protein
VNERSRRIAVFHLAPAEMADFVATDAALLRERYVVRPVFYQGSARGWPDAARILRVVAWSDANVSWFGDRQAYWGIRHSKLLGKKSFLILGGFDTCEEEDPDLLGRTKEIRVVLGNADESESREGLCPAWNAPDPQRPWPESQAERHTHVPPYGPSLNLRARRNLGGTPSVA